VFSLLFTLLSSNFLLCTQPGDISYVACLRTAIFMFLFTNMQLFICTRSFFSYLRSVIS
jgi:hypothetical protein